MLIINNHYGKKNQRKLYTYLFVSIGLSAVRIATPNTHSHVILYILGDIG